MLSEQFFSSVSGPPITPNTAISKDIGIYTQTLSPSYAVKATFKKSSAPAHCLAVSDTHVFTAQDQKAHVHVYSRQRGNQEALVPFSERIQSLTLAGDVLVLGTAEGRLILWETCTGRQVTTPPCHVQGISCIATTPYHILTGSDDSNVNVWSLARLLELEAQAEPEPDRSLSNHRGPITDLVASPGFNPETSLCVSASRDKTCIVWNYHSGHVLRTLLFPAAPLCVSLDPAARALVVASDDGGLFLVEFFDERPLLGSRSAELASIVVQVDKPLGVVDEDAGPPACLALSYDGLYALTGHAKGKVMQWSLMDGVHPTELANLNASVTNLVFVPPISGTKLRRPGAIVKPNQTKKQYTLTTQLEADLGPETRFGQLIGREGFSAEVLQEALLSLSTPAISGAEESSEDAKQDAALWNIANQQRAAQKAAFARYIEANRGA